jgi:SAM-dependent methyltransferase
MRDATALALNALNQALYADRADEWDAVRERPWRGFLRVAERLLALARDPLRLLDVGCGNGRFAQALAAPCASAGVALEYVGVDASEPLLLRARARLPARAQLVRADFVASAPDAVLPAGPFDAVVLFGVLHAVPGFARRRALLEAACARLAPGGLLALTRWRFAECPERRRRIAPWPVPEPGARAADLEIDPADLEPGDHLLAFGNRGALRYAHATSEAELEALFAGLPLERVEDWTDDGAERRENHYALRRRL